MYLYLKNMSKFSMNKVVLYFIFLLFQPQWTTLMRVSTWMNYKNLHSTRKHIYSLDEPSFIMISFSTNRDFSVFGNKTFNFCLRTCYIKIVLKNIVEFYYTNVRRHFYFKLRSIPHHSPPPLSAPFNIVFRRHHKQSIFIKYEYNPLPLQALLCLLLLKVSSSCATSYQLQEKYAF